MDQEFSVAFLDPATMHIWQVSGCQHDVDNGLWCNRVAKWVITGQARYPESGSVVRFLCDMHGNELAATVMGDREPGIIDGRLMNKPETS